LQPDALTAWRARLAADLLAAMRRRDDVATSALRGALSALDNATAVPQLDAAHEPWPRRSEVPRRVLSEDDCRAVLRSEVAARAAAAAEYERLSFPVRAARARAELDVLMRYLE
jgi:uncharacterized protein YqeY